jgi:hypothetical protein
MALNGNQGTLLIGDHATKVLSQRFAGMFLTESDVRSLPVESRSHGTVALVLETGALLYFDANGGSEGLAPDAGAGSWKDAKTAMKLYGRSMTFAAADLADADGFVESLATVTDPVTLEGEDLDGALVDDEIGMPPKPNIAFWPSVTADSSAGAFTPDVDIEFHGTYAGVAVTRVAQLTSADGDETIIADGPLETLTSIDIPAMADTDGALTFGFSGIGPKKDSLGNELSWVVVSGAAAADTGTTITVAYRNGEQDTVPFLAGTTLQAKPVRILSATDPITIYE